MFWTIVATAGITGLLIVLGMNFVTSEKQIERTVVHRHGIADAQFAREMSVILGPTIVAGNRITPLHNGDAIFPAMLEAIAGARETITFETFIYWTGDIGTRFAAALAERARAGVAVHVTIDWVGSMEMDPVLLRQMEEATVRLHRYRPLHWYNLGRLNNRTHRKLLVIDGRLGFTGGVGIADCWAGNAESPEHWRDSHYRVEGPVVAQLQAAYTDNWIKMTGAVLSGAKYFPKLDAVGDAQAQMFLASPAGGGESMHLMYLLTIAAAERTIDLAASYFVPDHLLVRAFIEARQRGVRIRLLVPGPHIDSAAVRVASKREWGPLLEAGVEVFEYQPTMLHTKLFVIDGLMVSVGSTNADLRSFRLNDEASLNVYDEDFAGEMTRVFEGDLQFGTPYTLARWQQRSWRERVSELVLLPFKSQL
ncbi:MAG: phospholipase D-like domain-containing protein [Gemmatimonadales bacterium]|nr:phospholipase D-like domain-containing protein [Gemmatimonadales bacterium]